MINIGLFYLKIYIFLVVKFSVYLNRLVLVMVITSHLMRSLLMRSILDDKSAVFFYPFLHKSMLWLLIRSAGTKNVFMKKMNKRTMMILYRLPE